MKSGNDIMNGLSLKLISLSLNSNISQLIEIVNAD